MGNIVDQIIQGDCLDVLKSLPDGLVNTCITSPPYFGLRDYGTATWEGGNPDCKHRRESKKSDKTITGHKNFDDMPGVGDAIYKSICPLCGAVRIDQQIGLEETPDEYVQRLVEVFREVRRVLRDDGTLWLNLGDSYNGSGKGAWDVTDVQKEVYVPPKGTKATKINGLKPKDLIGIPWRVAFALQADGWYLRQDIIWHKPNPMPESVKDRCTKAHEYIFLLSKSQRYYYDYEAIKEPSTGDSKGCSASFKRENSKRGESICPNSPMPTHRPDREDVQYDGDTRNKRSVWTVATKPFSEAHFATFPEELINPCVLAGSPEGGLVYDPFMGAGTTAYVAKKLGRHFLGSELNPEYIAIANKRIYSIEESLFI